MKKVLFFLMLSAFGLKAGAQSALLPYDEEDYSRIQRLEIKTNHFSPFFHSGVGPYARKDIARFTDSFQIQGRPITFRDFQYLNFLQADNPEWSRSETGSRKPFLRYFYPEKAALLYHEQADFAVRVNPIIYTQGGRDFARNENLYINSRGVEVHGHIGKKVGFYTYITENQVRAPFYLRQWTSYVGSYPAAGLTKTFKENAYDFLQARGYVTFSPVKDIIRIQFGHDRNFIGDGYRSFILSDFGKEYLFLKVNTKVWKLNYQNLFAEMVGDNIRVGSEGPSKKYIATHHLSYNILDNLNVGLFETVVFDRTDSNGYNSGFEANYLNPIIFYRSVEHGLNSSDNALLGINAKWNFLGHFSLYGQLTLDEFKIDEYRNNQGWWANKYAAQIGVKIVDALVQNLDLQYEFNTARPYTFMHFKQTQNYTHFRTPVGHPLGANFREHIALLTYRPTKRIGFYVTYIYSQKGLDSDSLNWGGDIFRKDYLGRVQEYGNSIGQGALTTVNILELRLSYQFAHRMFAECSWLYRGSKSTLEPYTNESSILNFGLRINLARPRNLF